MNKKIKSKDEDIILFHEWEEEHDTIEDGVFYMIVIVLLALAAVLYCIARVW